MTKSSPPAPPPFKDNPDVAEAFGDGLAGLTFTNGVLKLTFTTVRADHTKDPPPNFRAVTARLALPLPTVLDLQLELERMIATLKEKGVIAVSQHGPMTVQ